MDNQTLGEQIKVLQKASLADTFFFGGVGFTGLISLIFLEEYPNGQLIIFILSFISLLMGIWSFGRRNDSVTLFEYGMVIDYAKYKRTVFYNEIQEVLNQDKRKKRKRFITFPHFYLTDGTAFKLIIPIEKENEDLFHGMGQPGFSLKK